MSVKSVNHKVCEALGIEPHQVHKVELVLVPDDVPNLTIHRYASDDVDKYLAIVKDSLEYKEVLTDERDIVLMEEMNRFFYDKLAETGSLDKALLKAVWRAYLHGIKVGSKQVQCVGESVSVTY